MDDAVDGRVCPPASADPVVCRLVADIHGSRGDHRAVFHKDAACAVSNIGADGIRIWVAILPLVDAHRPQRLLCRPVNLENARKIMNFALRIIIEELPFI